ncbi:MAG: sigma 54-interacting transcriptional regulator [Candidatus Rokubacteria bacterium]|nr:sigma 54-interacting transcriptional regulator [Candidatus Rokubacteria bacterium]
MEAWERSTGTDDRLVEILRLAQQMNAVQDRAALLDLIAREARRVMDADRASIFLLDRERHELWSQVALGSAERLVFDAGSGIAGAVLASGRAISVADVSADPRFYADIDAHTGYRTHNVLAMPLRLPDGQVIGVFEILNKNSGTFTQDDEDVLHVLASQAATAIRTAETVEALRRENAGLRREVDERFSRPPLLGTSPAIRAAVALVAHVRDAAVTVLITGETGTGKELVARALHYGGPRGHGPFVALNCAAVPESLVESELFGIERGVATGVDRRAGKFEEAAGGTIFLDEIADLSHAAQAKLLRVLQERVVERVGGRKAITVDARILAATNKGRRFARCARTFPSSLITFSRRPAARWDAPRPSSVPTPSPR